MIPTRVVSPPGRGRVRLTVFGGLDLRGPDGEPIESVLAQSKRVAILVFLASESARGRSVPRERLLSHFWYEFDDERARNSLRTALHYLRKGVGPGVVLARADGALGTDPNRLSTDISDFLHAIDIADWDGAVAAYGGDLLDGFSLGDRGEFDAWIEGERLSLRRRAVDALWHHSVACENSGDLAEAVRSGRRAVELVPANEITLRRLLSLLDRLGNRAGAVATFENFVRQLEETYDLEPSPETTALIEQIRLGEGVSDTSVESTPSVSPPARRAATEPHKAHSRAERAAEGVVVLPFLRGGSRSPDSMGAGVQFALSVALERSGWDMQDPGLAVEVLDGAADGATPGTARIVAEELQVAQYVSGNITEVGGRLQLSAWLHSSTDGSTQAHASLDGQVDEFFDVVERLAKALVGASGT